MKYAILTVLFALSLNLQAKPSEKLINALIQVESAGNTKAIGDNGNAVGCLQLWESYVKSACTDKKKFTSRDRYSKTKSIEIFKSFMDKYATSTRLNQIRSELCALEKRVPQDISDDEIICRMHNGGLGFCYQTAKEKKKNDLSGRDRRIANTSYYWTKVQAAM